MKPIQGDIPETKTKPATERTGHLDTKATSYYVWYDRDGRREVLKVQSPLLLLLIKLITRLIIDLKTERP